MEYLDNPRKVYGKVEVTYSDIDISSDINVTTNGGAEISHPSEVIFPDSFPTVRACTMDGNATMDGTFEMMDDTCRCGWWSSQMATETGVFSTAPYIEINFGVRPIREWLVTGEERLGQFPVDFTLTYYLNGTAIRTDTITNNTEMRRTITANLDQVTAIRMAVQKWNTPNACAKIMLFYRNLTETYEGDALQMFELTEEMCNEEGNYNINADTLTVNIYNEDRKFDRGYLKDYMLLDRKLKPYIGIEKNGTIEYLSLGTYYSDEWSVSQDSQWVKCTAVDRLMRLQNKIYVGLKLSWDISLWDIVTDIFLKSGIPVTEYRLSEELKDMIVDTAFMPKQSVWDALQEVANAGLCKVYVDRDNTIVVRSDEQPLRQSAIQIGPSNMFQYTSNISLTNFANRIIVEYCEVEVTDMEVEAAMAEIVLEPHKSVEMFLDYTTEVAYGFIIGTNSNLQLSNFDGGVTACTVRVTNDTDTIQLGSISVFGDAIEINTKTIVVQDTDNTMKSGVVEYVHPASELVQSQEQAEWIGHTLLEKLRAGKGTITAEWRGDPALEVGDKYRQTDRFGDSKWLVCESTKYTYDGGLTANTRGRTI